MQRVAVDDVGAAVIVANVDVIIEGVKMAEEEEPEDNDSEE